MKKACMGKGHHRFMLSGSAAQALCAEAVSGDAASVGFSGCYISDMLSDVMANASEGDIWITMQTHPNIVAVALVKGLACIILTGSRQPQPETLSKARAEGVLIMTTPHSTFEAAGLLYNILNSRAEADAAVQG
ncbi:MAG: hypothetical protein LLF86_01065 [Nitrospiraceae bacterium]|nr:hypothetical protein [Nitrospiraceae bacterium]